MNGRRHGRSGGRTATKYRVQVQRDEDGMFVVECPELPGCISQGTTRTKALANIHEALRAYRASSKKHGEPIPPPIDEEIVEVIG